jgi:AraC family transcriptional regulator
VSNQKRQNLEIATSTNMPLRSPLITSDGVGWKDIYFEYHRQPPYETLEYSSTKHVIGINCCQHPVLIERTIDGRSQSDLLVDKEITIRPAQASHKVSWNRDDEFIVLSLEPSLVNKIAYETFALNNVEITPHFANIDPFIYQMGLTLKSELELIQGTPSKQFWGCGSDNSFVEEVRCLTTKLTLTQSFDISQKGSGLYAESIANLLVVHLLRNYSVQRKNPRQYSGGLSKRNLKRVTTYINDRLNQNLSLVELANILELSPYHFSKLFKQTTGFSPYQYVIHRRVIRAKELLVQDRYTISEVACIVGFANQSHLNRHFKKLMGMTPGAMLKK